MNKRLVKDLAIIFVCVALWAFLFVWNYSKKMQQTMRTMMPAMDYLPLDRRQEDQRNLLSLAAPLDEAYRHLEDVDVP